jgi:hypothetical protein
LYIKHAIMRKQILFVLALLVTSFGIAQDVKLTHNLPSSAAPGQTISAEFVVTKGNIGAFAKFQCDLPAGFTAENVDSKSGNFTFENNRVKIVWVSLPSEPSYTFTFKINIPASASGAASVGGQFYYLENNVKKEFDVVPQNISLGGSAAATTTPAETTSIPAATTNTPAETTSTPAATTTTPSETTSTPAATTTTPAETTSTPAATTTTPAETTSTPAATTTTPAATTSTPAETKTTPVAETKKAPAETKAAKTTPSASKSGVTYYIQVGALSSEPGGQYKKYGKTKVVQEGGMYKVLVGNYSSLEEARKHKPEMSSKGADGCFVVGYENGVRIKL